MQGWIEGFQESLDFIERNLTDELDIEVTPAKAACRHSIINASLGHCAG